MEKKYNAITYTPEIYQVNKVYAANGPTKRERYTISELNEPPTFNNTNRP
jgi:hypothetical protein